MMNNLFSNLTKATSNAIKSTIMDFDIEKEFKNMRESMVTSSKKLAKEIKRLQKHVHNYFNKWVIDVNFNQDTDIIQSQIKDNVLSIKVTNEETNVVTTFSTTIPNDVIIDSLVQKYNPQEKKAIFEFTKKDEVITEEEVASTETETTISEEFTKNI